MCNNGDVLSWSNCSAGHGDNERYMLAVQVARSTDAGHYKTLPQHHQSCRRRCRCIWLQFVADTTRVDTSRRSCRAAAILGTTTLPGPRGRGRPRRTNIHNCRRLIDGAPSPAAVAAAAGESATLTYPTRRSPALSGHPHMHGDLVVIRLILCNCCRAMLNA